MKKNSQLQKIISVLISVILMIEFTGCYSTRVISTSEINVSDKYLIHCKNSTYSIANAVISDGILSGKLDIDNKNNVKKTHIYLSSDLALKMNNGLLSVPAGSITRIEKFIPEPGKTTLFIILFVGVSVGISVGLIAIISDIIYSASNANTSTGFCSNW